MPAAVSGVPDVRFRASQSVAWATTAAWSARRGWLRVSNFSRCAVPRRFSIASRCPRGASARGLLGDDLVEQRPGGGELLFPLLPLPVREPRGVLRHAGLPDLALQDAAGQHADLRAELLAEVFQRGVGGVEEFGPLQLVIGVGLGAEERGPGGLDPAADQPALGPGAVRAGGVVLLIDVRADLPQPGFELAAGGGVDALGVFEQPAGPVFRLVRGGGGVAGPERVGGGALEDLRPEELRVAGERVVRGGLREPFQQGRGLVQPGAGA